MTLRYLLDTNVLSEPVRPWPDPHVMANLKRFEKSLATAALVWHELLFGVSLMPSGRRRETLMEYLERVVLPNIPILPYDAKAADWQAHERVRLCQLGATRPFVDGQIAAIAKTNSLVLVTSNEKDFRGFRDLKVENWKRIQHR